MDTRGRGLRSKTSSRNRNANPESRSSASNFRTRRRNNSSSPVASASASSPTLSVAESANQQGRQNSSEVPPAVSEVLSAAGSTTTQTPAVGTEEISGRRKSRRLRRGASENTEVQNPPSRRPRRRKRTRDPSIPGADRHLRSHAKSERNSQQPLINQTAGAVNEASSNAAEAENRTRRRRRKRKLEDRDDQSSRASEAQRRPSKRQRVDTASGTSVTARAGGMDPEEENGDSFMRNSDGQTAPNRDGAGGIQGLLRRLGAGLDELFPMSGSNSGRFRQILSILRTATDDTQRLEALTQLCDVLSIGTEESMVSFSVDSFVPPLVAILNSGGSPEMMLLASRALTHMMDALPSSASAIAQNGAATPLCANLLSIEFIDLAEQSLSALEKMSVDYPQSIVRAGGFAAALSFIDFFQTGVKRVAVSLACNLCRNPPSESVGMIVDVLPVMMTLLDSEDQRIRQSVLQGFARLAESFRSNSERLETFCGPDLVLIDKIVSLVCTNPSVTLTPASYSASLRLLSVLARGSAKVANKELGCEVLITTLRDIFDSGRTLHAVDALHLTDALLPDSANPHMFEEHFPRRRRRHSSSTLSAFAAVDAARREELNKNPSPLAAFGKVLFGSLVRFCNASANASIRRVILVTLTKYIDLATASQLEELLLSRESAEGLSNIKDSPEFEGNFSSFLAGLLGEHNSQQENMIGLRLVEIAIKKLHDLKVSFFREGVMYELERLGKIADEEEEQKKDDGEGDGDKPKNKDEAGRAAGMRSRFSKESQDIAAKNSQKAQELVNIYSSSEGDTDESRSVLRELDVIETDLRSTDDDEEIGAALTKFFKLLCNSGGVSNFELSRSALVTALVDKLASDELAKEVRKKRAIVFMKSLVNAPNQSLTVSLLVSRALGVLAAEENLTIFINDHSSSSTSMISGLRQLAQPLKLRLRRVPDCTDGGKLQHYSHQVVLIEPLASMNSIQDFLWSRVRPTSTKRSGTGDGDSPAPEKDNETEVPDGGNEDEKDNEDNENNEDNADEGDAGMTRESDDSVFEIEETGLVVEEEDDRHPVEGVELDHSLSRSDSEDEMVDEDEDEDEDDEIGDATSAFAGSDQLSRSLPPLDIDHDFLARSPSTKQASVTFGTLGRLANKLESRRSYVAAVTSGRKGKEGDTDQGPAAARQSPTERLSFSMNGHSVSHESSVLQAVLSSTAKTGIVKPRIWDEVHTLTYSLNAGEETTSDNAEGKEAGASSTKPKRRSRRLKGNDPDPTAEEKACVVPSSTKPKVEVEKEDSADSDESSSSDDDQSETLYMAEIGGSSSVPEPTATILRLLTYLHWIVREARSADGSSMINLSADDDVSFVSQKLTAKLSRQLSDPLALCGGAIPDWCIAVAKNSPFVFPFEVRRVLFHSTALGVARALNLLQARSDASSVNGSSSLTMGRSTTSSRDEARISRIDRQKVRVHRNRLVESAMRVLVMDSIRHTVLEIEYFDEAGTGLGPTLEFFTSVSRELQKTKLGLWRTQEVLQNLKQPEEKKLVIGKARSKARIKARSMPHRGRTTSQYTRGRKRGSAKRTQTSKAQVVRASEASLKPQYVIPTGTGLFPECIPGDEKAEKKIMDYFSFIGRFVAKASLDGRSLDVRFCTVFSQLILAYARAAEDASQSGGDYTKVRDRDLLKHFPVNSVGMKMLQRVDSRLAKSLQTILDMVERDDDETILSLCLTFTVPGHADVELTAGGADKEVTKENARSYVSKVVKYILFTGVKQQAAAFVNGFSELLSIKSLQIFRASELEILMCGPSFEKWTKEYLVSATRCDHGYRHESAAVDYLLRAMSELDSDDQRRFLQFVTGSPALPVGGLLGLHPRLIIVKRTTEDGRSPDECLPTVMTCTNYLKLPDYSSYEICKQRLHYAIREGQGSFHLS